MEENQANKKLLFVTTHYPPKNTGAAVVMKNLISGLDDECLVVTQALSFKDQDSTDEGVKVFKLFRLLNLLNPRLWYFAKKLLFGLARRKICSILEEEKITHVIGVYPDLDFLELARSAATRKQVRYYPYLHDTVVEGLGHKRQAKEAKGIQEQVFKDAYKTFVMSEGMRALYQRKYGIETTPLLHSFSEDIIKKDPGIGPGNNEIFFGGSVYAINKETAKRVHKACVDLDWKMVLSAANKMERLKTLGFEDRNIEIAPFLSREDYIALVESRRALLLSIDWPDESGVHPDELSTIFPTKTIEYLISGRPIIVHCPENYFLAQFFKKHQCGLVISNRDIDAIGQEINNLFENKALVAELVSNAYKTVEQFHISSVSKVLSNGLA